jgi:hypothetical protein
VIVAVWVAAIALTRGNPNIRAFVSPAATSWGHLTVCHFMYAKECRARPVAFIQSITSSARSQIKGGMVMPSALAVFILMTNSNFVGSSSGRSPGLAPFRILST